MKTVTNPESPRYGEFAFDLAENLAIGNDSEDVYLFQPGHGSPWTTKAGSASLISGNRRVQVFDKCDGGFVRTLGGVGQAQANIGSRASWDRFLRQYHRH
ncbi:MAG: hypothetical protein MZV64_52770 [Ignavibacteriales bacterium]|nr:hypothetical protein [Ignavibacteriales bacterium]